MLEELKDRQVREKVAGIVCARDIRPGINIQGMIDILDALCRLFKDLSNYPLPNVEALISALLACCFPLKAGLILQIAPLDQDPAMQSLMKQLVGNSCLVGNAFTLLNTLCALNAVYRQKVVRALTPLVAS